MSMYYPQLDDTEKDSSFIRAFNGLNHTEVIDESMFYDMENCCTDKYPLLTRRKLRMLSPDVNANVIGTMNGLAWVANGYFYYKGVQKFAVSGTVKQLVQFGAYICIFPQGIAYNTQTDEKKLIQLDTGAVTLTEAVGCFNVLGTERPQHEFNSYMDPTKASSTASQVVNGDVWRDLNFLPNPKIKKAVFVNSAFSEWVEVSTFYMQMAFTSSTDNEGFLNISEGDGIEFSGFTRGTGGAIGYWDLLNGTHVIQRIMSQTARELRIMIISPIGGDSASISQQTNVSLKRNLPDMDFVCANAGHLFGCSNTNHEIYVSANATPFNWNVFEGTANDSYAEVVGTPGDFTGCIAYRSTVLFFKEDLIHILYGKRPSAYQLDQLECVGLQKGCHNTLAIANETLFYKGKYGVYAYSGGLPELISDALGDYNKLTMTAGGSDGQKYFISGGGYVFSYDPRRGLWAKEDSRNIIQFAENGLDLYFIEDRDELSENLLVNAATSQTINGVTFTVGNDGSVTANGTATADAVFCVHEYASGESPSATLQNRVRLYGGGKDGSYQTYYLTVQCFPPGSNYLVTNDTMYYTLPLGYNLQYVNIVIKQGTIVDNVVFRPALRYKIPRSIGAIDNYQNIATETGLTFTSESNGLEWSATSGWIGLDSPDEKYISRLRLRLEIPLGSVFIVETAYDNNDTFTEVERVNGDGLRPVFINILPRRCDVMRLRFRGIGDFKLYSIAKQYEQGSDAY